MPDLKQRHSRVNNTKGDGKVEIKGCSPKDQRPRFRTKLKNNLYSLQYLAETMTRPIINN